MRLVLLRLLLLLWLQPQAGRDTAGHVIEGLRLQLLLPAVVVVPLFLLPGLAIKKLTQRKPTKKTHLKKTFHNGFFEFFEVF
jgi:hypothetical protein